MEQTIIAYYEAILRQTPTESQIDQWDAFLTEADDLEDALADFAQALCLQADEVRSILRLYQAVFDRMSDSGGLTFWTNRFRDIQEANPDLSYRDALIETISQWLESDEYIARFGDDLSDEDFLSLVYLNILGRPADQDGYNFWLAVLKSGAMSREQLIVEFTESDEFKADVDDEANGLLKAAAALDSDTVVDDLPYEFPGGDPYTGELGNEAPVDILIGTDIDEDADNGDEVNEGQLTVVDPDGGETFTWELIDPTGTFGLDDPNAQQPKIIVVDASGLDHETDDVMTVLIRVTDSDDNTYEEYVDIDINDINENPFNLGDIVTALDEQDEFGAAGNSVATFTFDDPDGDALTLSIESETVPGAFQIVGNELQVLDPLLIDADTGPAVHTVVVRATDGDGLFSEQTITVNVNAIDDEVATNVLPETLGVAATTPAGVNLTDLLAEDVDTALGSHTFVITGDPTGGAFGVDITGKKLVLVDPTLINSATLLDNGPVDLDGSLNGNVEFDLTVEITDAAGNTSTDTIRVTVDQSGIIVPFTTNAVEVLDGTEGDDTFTATSGGPGVPVTAQAGDIANGNGGQDLFILSNPDDNISDDDLITGVTLNDIESILLINRDDSGGPDHSVHGFLDNACTPCIDVPETWNNSDDFLIFEASLSPNIDHVQFGQSLASVGVTDLQAEFWTFDLLDPNDLGPTVDIFDVSSDWILIDSDPQAKVFEDLLDRDGDAGPDGLDDGEIVITVDEVITNHLRIRENSAGNEPGGPRAEEVGTITIEASGVPSIIGSLENGFVTSGPGPANDSITHTVNIRVGNLTGSRPSLAVGATAATANLLAIDFVMGHTHGIGDGLAGLEFVNIEADPDTGEFGDVYLVFDETANDIDSDGDGVTLTIKDGDGNGFFFFENDGFAGITLDGGEGDDTVLLEDSDDLDGTGIITNVERVKVLEDVGAPFDGLINLGAFDESLKELVLANGVDGDLSIINIPNVGGTTTQSLLCDDFGIEGFVVTIDQCCNDDGHPLGDLPNDFDLRLDADGDNTARVATVFNVDPRGGVDVTAESIIVNDINTYHLRVVDCDEDTDGLFQVRFLGSDDQALQTLLVTSSETDALSSANTTKILQDPASDPGGVNPTTNLTLIKGTDDNRNQEFLEFNGDGQLAELKFNPVFEDWGDDSFGSTTRPAPLERSSEADNIINELSVSANGAVVDLGDGDDIFTGNRNIGLSPGADFINGNGGDDLLFGAGGNDQIQGGTGDDEIQGEEGDDCLFGEEGDDLIIAGSGNDYADGGAEDDIIFGGSGEDHLRGGTGDDVICGDEGNDSLYGEDGNDLLIGGLGDDFLDAGSSGNDMLVGDYSCEPCYAHVTIADDDLEDCDQFHIWIDTDGDGVVDMQFTSEVGQPLNTPPGNVPADAAAIAADLEDQIQDWIDSLGADADCWDVTVNGPVVTICKVADDLVVQANGTDAAIPSVHKSELDGQIGDGDEFTWDIAWSGANPGPNETYTYKYDATDVKWNGVISPDGVVDTIAELKALADDIAADFAINKGVDLADFTMEVDANGLICLIGPDDKSGETPTVTVSAADDGGLADIPETPQVTCIDFGTGAGFEDMGDVVVIDFPGIAPNPYVVRVEDTDRSTSSEIAAKVVAAINADAGVNTLMTASIDLNDADKVVLTAAPGLGATGFGAVAVSVDDDVVDDEFAGAVFSALDLPGNPPASITLEIETAIGGGPFNYSIDWNTDLATTLQDFVDTYAATIAADHQLNVQLGAFVSGRLEFSELNGPEAVGTAGGDTNNAPVAGGPLLGTTLIDATVNGTGAATIVVSTDDGHADEDPITVDTTPGLDPQQDDTQSLDSVSQDNGVAPTDFDLDVAIDEKTEADQDVFVASARDNNMASFANNGYDNDDRPDFDFQGLLDAAGLATGNGADIGAGGVVYVMDFNQGSGGDLLNTFHINEAFDKAANTNDPGRFHDQLEAIFGAADTDRTDGDKLAFRKLDGDLDDCGTTFNYDEEQDQAVDRDDSDANAVNAFNANDLLRYYVSARSFEDALLDNHGLIWGVDVTQAIVDDAIADIADNGFADNSAGGIADGTWGNAADLLGGADATNAANVSKGILAQADGESWLRVYYNDADSADAAPEAVMELVGLDDVSQFTFKDIVGADCIVEDHADAKVPVDIWDQL